MKEPPVDATPVRAADGPSAEPLLGRLNRFVEEIARLLQTPRAPADFYAEFLQRVLAALGGVAAAVWNRTPQGDFQAEYQINLAQVGLDQSPPARASHTEILRRVAAGTRPLWVPPHSGQEPAAAQAAPANLTAYGVLLAPILVDQQAGGVLEVWQEPHQDAAARRSAGRFLAEVAGFAAAFLHKLQWRQLKEQQQLWAQCETFTRRIHCSLNPREVACLVANEGRALLGCDQVGVALRQGRTVQVEAVSGAAVAEPQAPLVCAMRELCDSVLTWGQKLVYAGSRDETLPANVRSSLDAYLVQSQSRTLVVVPLRGERDSDPPPPARAAVLAESFDPSLTPEQLEGRLQALLPHADTALHNALDHRRATAGLPARLADWARERGWRKSGLAVALLAALFAALVLIPAPLRIDARGQLLPKDRQTVYATATGKVVDVRAQHGDQVQKGQELLFVQDLETQLKIEQLAIKVAYAEQRLAVLSDQIAKAPGNDERNALLKERINQEYELRKAAVERDILLQESLNPRKAPVAAPLDGKMVTFDAREQLLGKTVKPGDALVRVARVQGPWVIERQIPEGQLAAIREGLQQAPGAALDVQVLLSSQPLRTYRARLRRDGLGGETALRDGNNVLPARVEVVDEELIAQLAAMPVGLEVRARIHCGSRSLGYVWFGDLLEFFHEHVLF
jgi:hypothetical protein